MDLPSKERIVTFEAVDNKFTCSYEALAIIHKFDGQRWKFADEKVHQLPIVCINEYKSTVIVDALQMIFAYINYHSTRGMPISDGKFAPADIYTSFDAVFGAELAVFSPILELGCTIEQIARTKIYAKVAKEIGMDTFVQKMKFIGLRLMVCVADFPHMDVDIERGIATFYNEGADTIPRATDLIE